MSNYYLFQDMKKCIGCKACEVQCKANKDASPKARMCQVVEVGPKMVSGHPRTSFIFMPCFHCENPWCVAACPTGAMQIRNEDGVVLVEKDLCVGCKTCISACPWGAPQWVSKSGKVIKCDYCADRLAKGLKPACVTVCPTGCLQFDLPENIPSIRRRRAAEAAVLVSEQAPGSSNGHDC